MSVTALAPGGGPTLRIRGTSYPVLLPSLRDPRLHLAAVIVSLQVLGQVAFDFQLSIAQILVALVTCALLEVGIAFRRQRVLLWPASALLTGNGVAFILRVPGTEHGDWWSMRGWWIFAGAAGVGLLSKYLIRFRGRHVFNPSNFGLVLCFLVLGEELAEPLDFWWGPMSAWLALALVLIVAGGFAILLRLRLLEIAVGFWLAFAGSLAVLAASGHAMTARWYLGPITDEYFWRVLAFSPEVLVFLFFMITDPKTIPDGRTARRVYAVAVGLLGALLIAPQTTEYASKVALLAALAIVCAARPLIEWLFPATGPSRIGAHSRGSRRGAATALVGAASVVGLLVLAGIPARSSAEAAQAPAENADGFPRVTVLQSDGVASSLDRGTALAIVRVVLADPRVAATAVEQVSLAVEPGVGQGPPTVVATLEGTGGAETPFAQTFELASEEGRFAVLRERAGGAGAPPAPSQAVTAAPPIGPEAAGFVAPGLANVAGQLGLDFRHGAFRFTVTQTDPVAMMGGGVCWLDYDGDGWLDLFAVNSYSELDVALWKERGGLPRSALFRNVEGKFVDVSRGSGADVSLRGNGCVAADFDLDGRTDLYVTSSTYDALLWNRGDGTFAEGARAAGIDDYGWHAGAAVGDLNGDGLPDLFVSGYTNLNAPVPDLFEGFPTTYQGVRDLLYLNEGRDATGRVRFREVGMQAGLESSRLEHGLGALIADLDGDGRLDLYVANDEDPNRLYANVPWPGGADADPAGLGFRLAERSRAEGVADPNAGMGIATADYDRDGRVDLLVTNSRGQRHAVYRGRPAGAGGPSFADARARFTSAFGTTFTGWGASWLDLELDGDLDLVLANGAVPVADLGRDAEPVKLLENLTAQGRKGQFADAGGDVPAGERLSLNGRGLAAADFDNDGDVDVAINQIGGPLALLENTNDPGNWLEVALAGVHPGATVTAVLPDGRRLVREVHVGSSYLSSEDPRVHLGLGAATKVDELVVRYPGGRETRLADVAAGRIVDLEQ
jgi:hypothetical protein